MTPRNHLPFLVLLAAFAGVLGCGPDVEQASHSSSGAGGSSAGGAGQGGDGAAGAGGGGGAATCSGALEVLPTTIAVTALLQSAPRIARGPALGHVLYSFVNAPSGEAGPLHAMDVDAFGAWPPAWSPALMVDADVVAYTLGPGPAGPLSLIHHSNSPPSLADALLPALSVVNAPISDDGTPLFVTGIPDRYFWAETQATGAYHVLHVGSYEPSSLPQSEQPLICTTTPHLGQAIASGKGFLAAFVEPNPPEPACDPAAPKPGTIVSLSRYSVPASVGSFLERSQGDRFVTSEPLVTLGLAPASFGVWVVFQTDGSTSLTPPPIVASRVDAQGQTLTPGGEMIPLSPGGFLSPALATAALGDTLAVAFIDAIDPSAPTIDVQLVFADGTLGKAAQIPTNDAWYEGSLQLVASEDQRSLFVAWQASKNGSVTAFARIDCLP